MNSTLNMFFLSKSYPHIDFHKEKDLMEPEPFGYVFQNPGSSRIPGFYISMWESGIYNRLIQEEWRGRMQKRKPVGKESTKESMLSGGLITLLFCAGSWFLPLVLHWSWNV